MADRIHALKTSDSRFARLVEEYHEVNRQIHRIETRVEPASEDVEEEFKRRRVRLKDEIAQLLEVSDVTYSETSPGRDQAAASRLRGGF
ncbi:MAG TPA: YdcH family protein [Beijerinckiaceae bacterium]